MKYWPVMAWLLPRCVVRISALDIELPNSISFGQLCRVGKLDNGVGQLGELVNSILQISCQQRAIHAPTTCFRRRFLVQVHTEGHPMWSDESVMFIRASRMKSLPALIAQRGFRSVLTTQHSGDENTPQSPRGHFKPSLYHHGPSSSCP